MSTNKKNTALHGENQKISQATLRRLVKLISKELRRAQKGVREIGLEKLENLIREMVQRAMKHLNKDEPSLAKSKVYMTLKNIESAAHRLTSDQLLTLYKAFQDRMLSDNDRIWKITSIMLPVSFAPIAALTALSHIALWQIVVLALTSVLLAYAWFLMCENHCAFQQKSEAWMSGILMTLGIEDPLEEKVSGGCRDWLSVASVRRIMLWVIVLGWAVIAIAYFLGSLQLIFTSKLQLI